MNSKYISTFCCKHCRHYCSSRQRGEFCKLLLVKVQGDLTGCSFYIEQNPNLSKCYQPYTHPIGYKFRENLLSIAQDSSPC
jgi:hypothetical protein